MYKFQPINPKKPKNIDGILSSGPRRPRRPVVGNKNVGIPGFYPLEQRRIDSFDKAEGFRGRTLPRLDESGGYQKPPNLQQSRRPLQPIQARQLLKQDNKSRKRRQIFKRTALVGGSLVLIFAAVFIGKAWWSAHKVFRGGGSALAFNANIDPHLLNGEGDGRVNILLLGKGGEGHAGGDLTDSMMIASIDPINNKLAFMSIPRDLWVQPRELGHMKINAVYANVKNAALNRNYKDKNGAEDRGINAVTQTVEKYMGINIHYYSMIDFVAFEEAVNTIGGIDITLEEPFSDPTMLVGRRYFSLPAGKSHLNGGYALAYARSRYGTSRGDFDRGEQQQKVIVGIKNKIMSTSTYANPVKVSQLLGTFGSKIRTNLSIDDTMRVYGISKRLSEGDISHFDLAQEPRAVVKTANIAGQSVVIPKAGVDNYDQVKAFVRNKLKDGFIIKENPSIIVLNGTNTVGLAQRRADELKSYGYKIARVGDATVKDIQYTVLIDKTKGKKKYTKRYLERRLNVKAVGGVKG
ncbi:MAG TPA: LCP family protein, partial [Candidatus Saccharibacteria bacterium]|nr:LCP family protein [Candidatus Saccharibacteria bacterium]